MRGFIPLFDDGLSLTDLVIDRDWVLHLALETRQLLTHEGLRAGEAGNGGVNEDLLQYVIVVPGLLQRIAVFLVDDSQVLLEHLVQVLVGVHHLTDLLHVHRSLVVWMQAPLVGVPLLQGVHEGRDFDRRDSRIGANWLSKARRETYGVI